MFQNSLWSKVSPCILIDNRKVTNHPSLYLVRGFLPLCNTNMRSSLLRCIIFIFIFLKIVHLRINFFFKKIKITRLLHNLSLFWTWLLVANCHSHHMFDKITSTAPLLMYVVYLSNVKILSMSIIKIKTVRILTVQNFQS